MMESDERFVASGPLSFCQELLYLRQLVGPIAASRIAEIVEIKGPLDPGEINSALERMIAAHDSLRTAFLVSDGRCTARVYRNIPRPDWRILKEPVNSIEVIASEVSECLKGMDPSAARTCSGLLVRSEEDRWLWMLAFHHLASDGWSQHLYGKTFSNQIRAAGQKPVPITAATPSLDYARKQRSWLTSQAAQTQLEWWINHIDRIPDCALPVSVRNTTPASSRMVRIHARSDAGLHTATHNLAQRYRVPLLAVMLAALARHYHRRTASPILNVLSLVNGRSLSGGYRATGAFYNSVFLSLGADCRGTAEGLLKSASKQVFDAINHQEIPASLISKACARRGQSDLVSRAPIMFNLIRHALSDFQIPGCRMAKVHIETLQPLEISDTTIEWLPHQTYALNSPLTIVITDLNREFHLSVDLCSERFEIADGRAFATEYLHQLRLLCEDLGENVQPVHGLDIGQIY